jgi:hypothetical protein
MVEDYMRERVFYTYLYLDPRKPGPYNYQVGNRILRFPYEPFYVGKGNGKRYKHNTGRNFHLKNKISKIRKIAKKSHRVFKFNCSSEYNSLLVEALLIRTIGREDLGLGSLVNFTDGGQGYSNPSKETRRKQSVAKKGIPLSKEHRRKISLRHKGKVNSEETRVRMGKAQEGNTKNSGIWKLTSPRGNIFKIVGLWGKCRERDWPSTIGNPYYRKIAVKSGFWKGWKSERLCFLRDVQKGKVNG